MGVSRVKFIAKFQNLFFFAIFSNFSAFTLKKTLQFCLQYFHNFLLGILYESIIWVIMGRWGYSQNAGVLVVLVLIIYVHIPSFVTVEHEIQCLTCIIILASHANKPIFMDSTISTIITKHICSYKCFDVLNLQNYI